MIRLEVMQTIKVRVSRMSTLADCVTLHVVAGGDEMEITLHGLPKEQILHLCRVLGDANSRVRLETEVVSMPEWLIEHDVHKEMGV